MSIPTFETNRLIFRPFNENDLPNYAEMCNDPTFMRFLADGKPLSRAETWRNIAFILGHWHLRGYGIWAIEEKSSHQLIGRTGLLNPEGWPDIEVCWALSPKHWGKGFATEAAKKVINWGFDNLPVEHLISLIHPENKPSASVSMRIGQEYKKQISLNNKTVNVYSISRTAIL